MIRYLIAFLLVSALMYPAPKEPTSEAPRFDDRWTAGSSISDEDFDRWNN